MLQKNFILLFSFKIIFLVIFILPSYSEDWHTSSGNYKSLKHSELEIINSVNVKDLNLVWIYRMVLIQIAIFILDIIIKLHLFLQAKV